MTVDTITKNWSDYDRKKSCSSGIPGALITVLIGK
jgi:hypothetical protein